MNKLLSAASASLVLLISAQAQAFTAPVNRVQCTEYDGSCETSWVIAHQVPRKGYSTIELVGAATSAAGVGRVGEFSNVSYGYAIFNCSNAIIYRDKYPRKEVKAFGIDLNHKGSPGFKVKIWSNGPTPGNDKVTVTATAIN